MSRCFCKKNKNIGQSTLEFLLVFSFVLSFLFYFVKITYNATTGFLFHYVNFLGSRAYLVFDSSGPLEQDDTSAENYVREKIINRYPLKQLLFTSESSQGINFKALSPQNSPKFIGTVLSFKQEFSFSKIMGGGLIEYESESFLGREPTRQECLERVCKSMEEIYPGLCASQNLQKFVTFYDNGC